MCSNNIAIRVGHLSKRYEIYQEPRDRLKQFVLPRLQRYVGIQPKHYYKEFWALHDLSIDIEKGEAVGVIGRNGAGKSTLLQLICGTLSPTSGFIELNGVVAALLELGSGFNPEFTGRENVYLNASLLGLSQKEIEEKFEEITEFADIGDFLEQSVKTYSSGMLMRLAFAVNTCVEPEILIVDEALGVGDTPFQSKCFKRLKQLMEDGTTILFVSHDMSTVRTICKRALWLKDGKAEMWGSASEVAREYTKYCWGQQGVDLKHTRINSTDDNPPEKEEEISENKSEEIGSNLLGLQWTKEKLMPLESSDRYGNYDIRITGLELRNQNGEIVNKCDYGEVLDFIYYMEANADVDSDISIGLLFRDVRGTAIYAANNFKHIDRIRAKKGQKIIAISKLAIPLSHQDYVIQLIAYGFDGGNRFVNGECDFSRAIIWDTIEKAMILTVLPNKPLSLSGPVHVDMNFNYQVLN